VRFAAAVVAIVVIVVLVALVVMIAIVAMVVAMVAVVLVRAFVALVVMITVVAMVVTSEIFGSMHKAALDIGTRARLAQAWIDYCSRIRNGQRQDQTSHHLYDDRSDFHDDLPKRKRVMR
jgi:ABC-type multidrug transport system fused ATPase/permease subunit